VENRDLIEELNHNPWSKNSSWARAKLYSWPGFRKWCLFGSV